MSKCTPEYNDETRRLIRLRNDLARIAKGAEKGDFSTAIRAKANEFIDDGLTAQEVLDKTHAYINDYAPHSKEEVSDAITLAKRSAPTKNEAREQRNLIRSELRDMARASQPEPAAATKERQPLTMEQKIAIREKQLEKEIDDLNNGIERQKGPPLDSARIRELRDERDGLKAQLHPEPEPRTPDERKLATLEKRLADLQAGRERAGPTQGPDTQRIADLKDQIARFRASRKPEPANPAVTADSAAQARIKARIADIDRQLAGGERPGPAQGPESKAVADLKAQRDAKQAELDAARAKRRPTEEDRKVTALEKQLADVLAEKPSTGPGATRPDTQRVAEAREKLQAARDARDAANAKPEPTRNETANKRRATILKKQLAELDRRFKENDFEKPQRPGPPDYTEEVRQQQLQVDTAKRRLDEMVEKAENRKRPMLKKVLELIHADHLFNIFLTLSVYGKLGSAVVGGHALAVDQAANISMLKYIPAIRRLADISARQGAGLTVSGLKARFGQGLREAPRAAFETLKHGRSRLEAAYGDSAAMSDAYLGHMGTIAEAWKNGGWMEAANVALGHAGRTHGMIKVFLAHPEFFHSLADQVTQVKKQLRKQGKSDDQITEFLGRETTRATMNARAMADAMESKMQGKNKWNDKIASLIQHGESSDNPVANIIAFAARTIFPVLKVGPNVFKQGTSLLGGGVKAAAEAISVRRGKKPMTQEQADYILKNLGQQVSGIKLIALGIVLSGALGGTPRPGDKKRQEKEGGVKADEGEIAGVTIAHQVFHGAPFSLLQIGSGLVHVYEEEMKLNHEQAVDAALASIGTNLWNWTERTIPYTDQLRRTSNTAEYGRGPGEVVGNTVRSMVIPLALQQAAAAGDEFKGFRKPRSIAEDVKLGVPGLRETVPIEREKRKH